MTAQTWDDFPLLRQERSVERIDPGEEVIHIDGTRFLELPDNGYQLLLAWSAGPLHACRRIDTTEYTVTTTIRGRGDQPPHVAHGPRTEEDWQVVDDMVNSYLREAGVPPRPRGFLWYLELPKPLTPDDVWGAIELPTTPGTPVEPSDVRNAMVDAVARLYP